MSNQCNDKELSLTITDPFRFIRMCWPDMTLYHKQRDIIKSVSHNSETIVHAANQTGKTRIAATLAIWFFMSRSPSRVVISSSSEGQLRDVLWREICSLIRSSAIPLPIEIRDLSMRKIRSGRRKQDFTEDFLVASATNTAENFQGHHLPADKPRVLAILDEASGIPGEIYEAAQSWAHRMLVIGNPISVTGFFYHVCKAGDMIDPSNPLALSRKVIHIDGRDVPNVAVGLQCREKELEVPPPVIPGLLDFSQYLRRAASWDEQQRTTRLFGQFYEGAEVLLFPPALLDRAFDSGRWRSLKSDRKATAMGIDVAADGPDFTCWTIVDRHGVIEQITRKTPNTMEIPGITIDLMRRYGLSSRRVAMDIGGGGKQLADRLNELGHEIVTINFGASALDKQAYPNRRAELYGTLRDLLVSRSDDKAFALPPECHELRQELSGMPILRDSEGRLMLPPKRARRAGSNIDSLHSRLGRSPDRADSLVLAVWVLIRVLRSRDSSHDFIVWPAIDSFNEDSFSESWAAANFDKLSSINKAIYETGRWGWIYGDDD